jgi:hypothetical protein
MTPEQIADSHGAVLAGAAGTAAGDTDLGDITLPAGGPWKLFGLWGQVVPATATAAELIGGYLQLHSRSGDIAPDPSPCKVPLPKCGSFLGATADQVISPLVVYPIDFDAAGKAVIDLIYHQDIACTVAPQVVAGILFGKTIPEPRRFRFAERARAVITVATDATIGTITLSEKASRITGITAEITQDGVLTAGEEILGFVRLSSDDINMSPAQYPCVAAYGAGLGALINAGSPPAIPPIPLEIPVLGGSRIDCFLDLNTAVTNALQASVTIFYE